MVAQMGRAYACADIGCGIQSFKAGSAESIVAAAASTKKAVVKERWWELVEVES